MDLSQRSALFVLYSWAKLFFALISYLAAFFKTNHRCCYRPQKQCIYTLWLGKTAVSAVSEAGN